MDESSTPVIFQLYPEKLMAFEGAVRRHTEEPSVSYNDYYVKRRLAWGQTLASVPRLYLDTNYWIYLRDVELQRPRDTQVADLHAILGTLAAQGKVRCPISYHNIAELMKQSDLATRSATARVIDRLSGGSTIQPFPVVLKYELENSLSEIIVTNARVVPNIYRVWTRPAYVLGDLTPEAEGMPFGPLQAIKKAIDDLMWGITLQELIEATADDVTWPMHDEAATVAMLNQGKALPAGVKIEFIDLYKAEVEEILGTQLNTVEELIPLVLPFGDPQEGFGKYLHQDSERSVTMMGLQLCEGKLHRTLSTVHVQAALHARFRQDKARKYKKGDLQDLGHAAAALPYHNALLTENSLAHSLNTKPTNLAHEYDAKVISDVNEAILFVKGFA